MDEKELQNGLMMYQLLQNQLEELKKQGAMIQTKMAELESTLVALEEVEKFKGKEEILIPLGSGIFVSGQSVKDPQLLADLGAGILTKKTPAKAKDVIEAKKKDIEGLVANLQKDIMGTMERMNQLGEQLQTGMTQAKK